MIELLADTGNFLASLKSTSKFANPKVRYDSTFECIFYRFKKTIFTALGTDGSALGVYKNKRFHVNKDENLPKEGIEFVIPLHDAKILIYIIDSLLRGSSLMYDPTTIKIDRDPEQKKHDKITITFPTQHSISFVAIRNTPLTMDNFLKPIPKVGSGEKVPHIGVDSKYTNMVAAGFKALETNYFTIELFGQLDPIIFTSDRAPEFMVMLMPTPMRIDGPSQIRDDIAKGEI